MSSGNRHEMPREITHRSRDNLCILYEDGYREEFLDKERIRWVLLECHSLVSFQLFLHHKKTPYYSFNFFVKRTEANFLKKIYGDFHIDFSSILSKFEAFKRPEVTQYGFQINAKIILRFLAEKQIMKELLYIF